MLGNNNNNNNLQFGILQKNEAIVHESFIQIFGMASTHFSEFLTISKNNFIVPRLARLTSLGSMVLNDYLYNQLSHR
jgi:hypothetical protein